MSQDIVKQARELLISARTIEEQKIAKFAEGVALVDTKKVFGDLEIPAVISLKELCPECYKEEYDPDVYEKEFAAMDALFDKMNECIINFNKGALQCIQEFQMLS